MNTNNNTKIFFIRFSRNLISRYWNKKVSIIGAASTTKKNSSGILANLYPIVFSEPHSSEKNRDIKRSHRYIKNVNFNILCLSDHLKKIPVISFF